MSIFYLTMNIHGASQRFILRLFIISTAVNYVWEMAQMPLYQDMPFAALSSWLLCFRASLGDGLIIVTIWTLGAGLYKQARWFRPLRRGPALLLLASGALIAVAIELHALANQRWAYSDLMPIVPWLEIGLSPFVQLLLLPWCMMILADLRLLPSRQ